MAKLNEEQKGTLICKLRELLEDLEVGDLENVVEKGKAQALYHNRIRKRSRLIDLFEKQVETLQTKGCPRDIREKLRSKIDRVILRVMEMNIPEYPFPFIQVIPPAYMGMSGLMQIAHGIGNVFNVELDPYEIEDRFEAPLEPYFILGVDIGELSLGSLPEEIEKIEKQKRSPLTVYEVIAMCTHQATLSGISISCAGSKHCSNVNFFPMIRPDERKLNLQWDVVGITKRWPSCRERL